MKKIRKGTWYWRIWWWFGYHGLYQINLWWKIRKQQSILNEIYNLRIDNVRKALLKRRKK